MTNARRIAGASGALALLAAVVVGVPFVLVRLVGNPWPGRTRLELRDEVGVIVGVLAALAWLVWARFVVAVVVELRDQLAALRAEAATRSGDARRGRRARPGPRRHRDCWPSDSSPPRLIILPVATRSAPVGRRRAGASCQAAGPPPPLVVDRRTRATSGGTAGGDRASGGRRSARRRAGRHADRAGPRAPRRCRSLAGDLRPQPRSATGRRRPVGDAEPDPPRLAAAPARLDVSSSDARAGTSPPRRSRSSPATTCGTCPWPGWRRAGCPTTTPTSPPTSSDVIAANADDRRGP